MKPNQVLLLEENNNLITSRRRFIRNAGILTTSLAVKPLPSLANAIDEDVTFADGPRELVKYPQKRPLILVTTRPPHLETPFEVFNQNIITPNDAFFVRYHLANIPTTIDPHTYRLTVKGKVKIPLNLSLHELQTLGTPVEIVAVNQCSGNSRGFSSPRVFGAQLANGAMGNARWLGLPLKIVLKKAGINANAKQVVFNGLDQPILPSTSAYKKTLDIEHALHSDVLLAWNMNGEDIPFLNGYPLKLIVPGYFGTYWIKHLSEIEVIDQAFEGHDALFMTKGYRVPDNDCQCVAAGTTPEKTRPISSLPVRSFITNISNESILPVARTIELKGIAFDGGAGIKTVDVSIDGGQTWRQAKLGADLGRYSFREWRLATNFSSTGKAKLLVRAKNRQGEVQPTDATWNPSGYRRHVIETYNVTIA